MDANDVYFNEFYNNTVLETVPYDVLLVSVWCKWEDNKAGLDTWQTDSSMH